MNEPGAPAWREAPLDVDLVMAVGAGGAVGSLLRWLLAEVIPNQPGEFPWSTYLVNVLGSALLGLLAGLRPRWPRSPQLYTVLTVGVLGGFTTFSTFALQGSWLIEHAKFTQAAAFLIGSVLLGVVAAALGLLAGARLRGAPEPGEDEG